MFNWRDTYFSYINLAHRKDRDERMIKELARVGLTAERTEGMLPSEYKGDPAKVKVMFDRTKGAIGCHYSQVLVMEKAFFHGKHAGVFEDDLIFASDIIQRLDYIQEFINEKAPDFDVIWLGGTYHKQPEWHKSVDGKHTHPDLLMCECNKNADWEPTEDTRIVRTYGCWSTYAYIVNFKSIPKVLTLLEKNVHLSMGIDWLFILLQPVLKTYAFNPGMVKQYNNKSDIGSGITNFSGFQNLGRHWWADKMVDYKY